MTLGDFTRWLYRGRRPNWIARILNKASAAVASSGRRLQLPRDIGSDLTRVRATVALPLGAVVDGQRCLVEMTCNRFRTYVQPVEGRLSAAATDIRSNSRRFPLTSAHRSLGLTCSEHRERDLTCP
jgi:hypothetical protein